MSARSTRRAHRKSRMGCDQCKAKRVKVSGLSNFCPERSNTTVASQQANLRGLSQCDEQGPSCANCAIRQTSCSYSGEARVIRDDQQRASIPAQSPGETSSCSTQRSVTSFVPTFTSNASSLVDREFVLDRTLELELMHHYSTKTYVTFCNQYSQAPAIREKELELLQDYIPRQGIRNTFLLHALFAITALHIFSIQESPTASKFLNIALEYQSLSQGAFYAVLQNLDKDNCHIMLATSFALFILAVAVPQHFPVTEERSGTRASILSVLRLFKGSWHIVNLFREPLLMGPFGSFLTPNDMSIYEACESDAKQSLDRLSVLVQQSAAHTAEGTLDRNLYLVKELEDCFRRLRGGVNAAIFGWLSVLPDNFVADLNRDDLISSLIFMHWGVLLDRSSDVWWSLKSGKELVDDLCVPLHNLSQAQHEIVLWCRMQVGLPITPNQVWEKHTTADQL